jgi:hypothetical protein
MMKILVQKPTFTLVWWWEVSWQREGKVFFLLSIWCMRTWNCELKIPFCIDWKKKVLYADLNSAVFNEHYAQCKLKSTQHQLCNAHAGKRKNLCKRANTFYLRSNLLTFKSVANEVMRRWWWRRRLSKFFCIQGRREKKRQWIKYS